MSKASWGIQVIEGTKPPADGVDWVVLTLLAGRITGLMVRLLVPIVLARLLSQDDYGRYRQTLVYFTLFGPVLLLGLDKSIYYFMSRSDELQAQAVFLSVLHRLLISVFVLFQLAAMVLWWVLPTEVLSMFAAPGDYFIVIAYIGLAAVAVPLDSVITVQQQPRRMLCFFVGNSALLVAIMAVGYLLMPGLRGALTALAVFECLRYCMLVYISFHEYPLAKAGLNWALVKDVMRYSLPLSLGSTVGNIARQTARYTLVLMVSPSLFAIYAVANFRIPYLDQVFLSLNSIAVARMAPVAAHNEREACLAIWREFIIKQSIFVVPSIVFFAVHAEAVVLALFGSQYAESVPLFRGILLALIPNCFPAALVPTAFGATGKLAKIDFGLFVISLPLSILSIHYFGLWGGVVSDVLISNACLVLQMSLSARILGCLSRQVLPTAALAKITAISLLACLPAVFVPDSAGRFIRLGFAVSTFLPLFFLLASMLGLLRIGPIITAILVRLGLSLSKDG
jgi:O-antigen/teichoic acid export membrane protein